MYLLLVDYDVITEADLQAMIEQSPAGTDIINSFSTTTLLKVAEKISPDVIIIDFDLVGEDRQEFFRTLHKISDGAQVLALIDADHYDKLYEAIDSAGIDDFIVKPIRKEDFLARTRIAANRKISGSVIENEDIFADEAPTENAEALDIHEFVAQTSENKEDKEDKEFDFFSEQTDPEPVVDADLVTAELWDDESALSPEREELLGSEQSEGELLEKKQPEEDLLQEAQPEEGLLEEGLLEEEPNRQPVTEQSQVSELDWFNEQSEAIQNDEALLISEIELDHQVDSSEMETEDLDFGVIDGEASETEPEEDQTVPEIHSFAAIDDPQLSDKEEKRIEFFEGDLFADSKQPELAETKKYEQADEISFELFEDVIDGKVESEKAFSDWEEEISESRKQVDQTGPAVIEPEAEFLDGFVPPTKQKALNQNIDDLSSDLSLDDERYFEDLFRDPKSSNDTIQSENDLMTKEIMANDLFDAELEDDELEMPVDRNKKNYFPGESADEFLFGSNVASDEEFDSDDLIQDLFAEDVPEKKSERFGKSKGKKGRIGRITSIAGNIVFVMLLLVMAVLSFFLIQSRLSGGVPQIAGYQMYIVLSGSMSPEFETGSLAFVHETEPEAIVTGDIITYRSQPGSDSLTTHRVVEVLNGNDLRYVTRGDANNVNDPNPVIAENVVGRVTGSVPYIGYLMDFVQTRQGLILLIFVPGVLIIVYELSKILRYISHGQNDKRDRSGKAERA